jgi:hypothetical protein
MIDQSKAVLWIEAISSILSKVGCYYLYFVQFCTKVKLTKFGGLYGVFGSGRERNMGGSFIIVVS